MLVILSKQLDTVVEPSSTATPTPLLVKPIPKPRPVTTVSKPQPVRPIPKPRPQLIPIAKPQPDLELPAVNFIVHKKNLKRPCNKDSEDVKKKKFYKLIKDKAEQEIQRTSTNMLTLMKPMIMPQYL